MRGLEAFEATLHAIGAIEVRRDLVGDAIKGIKECLAVGNEAPLRIALEDAWNRMKQLEEENGRLREQTSYLERAVEDLSAQLPNV